MKLRVKNTYLTIQLISWLQLVGGTAGLGLIAYLLLRTGTITGPVLLIFLIGLSLFSYSIYCGKRLLTDQQKSTALIHSIINQALQIFQWRWFGYAFTYSSGTELTIGLEGLTFKFNVSLFLSSFQMAIQSEGEFLLKINVIAILILYVLIDIFKELRMGNPVSEKQTDELRPV